MTKKINFFIIVTMFICMFTINTKADENYTVISSGKNLNSAKSISIGTNYATELDGNNVAYFKFTTPNKNGFTYFTLKDLNVQTHNWAAGEGVTGEILNSVMEKKCSILVHEDEEKSCYDNRLTPNTTYYLKIYNSWVREENPTGYIRFNLKFKEDKEGDTLSNAKAISLNKNITGSLDGDSDFDWYKFKTSNYTRYTFYAKNIDINCGHWSKDYAIQFLLLNEIEEKIEWLGLDKGSEDKVEVNLRPYTTYYIKIYNPNYKYSSEIGKYKLRMSPIIKLSKPTNFKVKKIKKKTFKLTWKKVSGATGYEIYRSTKKKSGFKNIGTISNRNSYKSKVTKKKTYYYKIRAIKKDGNQIYKSSYSVVKKVK